MVPLNPKTIFWKESKMGSRRIEWGFKRIDTKLLYDSYKLCKTLQQRKHQALSACPDYNDLAEDSNDLLIL